MAGAILAIGVLVFLAHFFTALFERKRVPDVLLLTILGILIGPIGHFVKPEDFGHVGRVMSTLALIVILFESGITIDPPVLARAIRPTLRVTFATFFATVIAAYFASVYLLGVPHMTGWIAGAILGGVSAAVVIPLVKSMKIREPLGTTLVMESALGDVLCIVILLGLVEGAAAGWSGRPSLVQACVPTVRPGLSARRASHPSSRRQGARRCGSAASTPRGWTRR